jgi:hypothetical protein
MYWAVALTPSLCCSSSRPPSRRFADPGRQRVMRSGGGRELRIGTVSHLCYVVIDKRRIRRLQRAYCRRAGLPRGPVWCDLCCARHWLRSLWSRYGGPCVERIAGASPALDNASRPFGFNRSAFVLCREPRVYRTADREYSRGVTQLRTPLDPSSSSCRSSTARRISLLMFEAEWFVSQPGYQTQPSRPLGVTRPTALRESTPAVPPQRAHSSGRRRSTGCQSSVR